MERTVRQWWGTVVPSEDVRMCLMVLLAALFGFTCSYLLASALDLSGYIGRGL